MRKALGGVATLALTAGGLVSFVPAATADVRAPFSYTIHRLADESEAFEFREGESAVITATISLGPDWSGWPETRTSTMTFTQGELFYTESTFPDETALAPGVWHYYSSVDSSGCDYSALTESLTLPVTRSCVDTIELVTTLYGELFESDHTLDFDVSSWGIYFGSTAQTAETNMVQSISAEITGAWNSSAPLPLIPGADVAVSVEVEGCVDESNPGLQDGSAVVQEVVATIDGEPISELANADEPFATWTTAPYFDDTGTLVDGPDFPEEFIRFTSEPAENVTVGVSGELLNLNGSALSISYDITKDGVSVAEDCPLDDFTGLPTLSDTSQNGDIFDASTLTHSLPDGLTIDASTVRDIRLAPDGFGGEFIYPEEVWGEAFTGTVFHLTPDGPSDFSDGDGLSLSSSIGLLEFEGSAWGAGGSRWATFHYSSNTRFTINIGTFGSPTTKSVRARLSTIDGVCGSGWFGAFEKILPLQTSKLLVQIQCSKYTSTRSYNKTLIASVTLDPARPFKTVATIGTPTKTYPTTCIAIGVDPTATGTDTALIALSRKMKYTRESCDDLPVTGDILLTRIDAKLTVGKKTVTTNPFAGGSLPSWPSESLVLTPGETRNTWRGMQVNREWDESFENSTVTWTPFTISAGKSIVELTDLELPDRFGTGNLDPGNLVPTPGNSAWVLMNVESDEFDGETTTYVTSSTLNPQTGESSSGESATLTNFGYTQMWMYQGATSFDGVPLYYALGPNNTYSVTRWDPTG